MDPLCPLDFLPTEGYGLHALYSLGSTISDFDVDFQLRAHPVPRRRTRHVSAPASSLHRDGTGSPLFLPGGDSSDLPLFPTGLWGLEVGADGEDYFEAVSEAVPIYQYQLKEIVTLGDCSVHFDQHPWVFDFPSVPFAFTLAFDAVDDTSCVPQFELEAAVGSVVEPTWHQEVPLVWTEGSPIPAYDLFLPVPLEEDAVGSPMPSDEGSMDFTVDEEGDEEEEMDEMDEGEDEDEVVELSFQAFQLPPPIPTPTTALAPGVERRGSGRLAEYSLDFLSRKATTPRWEGPFQGFELPVPVVTPTSGMGTGMGSMMQRRGSGRLEEYSLAYIARASSFRCRLRRWDSDR